MAAKFLPEIADLRNCLAYDPESGSLIWRSRPVSDFCPTARETAATRCKQWNTRCAGQRAFATVASNGYLFGTFRGKPLTAHRVIWALTHGAWPVIVDHINGDRTDNRLSNLREVDTSDNVRNSRLQRRNTSGVPGVRWDPRKHRWCVRIGTGSGSKYLGSFKCVEEAAACRHHAEKELGYHPNHGRE